MRVLLLSTPLSASFRRDGATRAVVDLARGLLEIGGAIEPVLFVREGTESPKGCEAIVVRKTGMLGRAEVLSAAVRARSEVIHAVFAPRFSTAVMLRALGKVTGARLVQTVASVPRRLDGVRHALASETVIATSASTMRALIEHGIAPERLQRIAMPFAPENARSVEYEAGGDDASRDTLLFAGDYEFGDAIFPTLRAFAEMSAPIGVVPKLVIAARRKTKRAAFVEARVREEIARSEVLRARVSIVGEVDSLLPFIARARCVLLPASSTYAKLDHPRVLLESIALGTRIIVGSAPSLAELVVDPTIGEVTHDVPSLREAMERAFDTTAMSPKAILEVLAERSPRTIAERYAQIYREKQV